MFAKADSMITSHRYWELGRLGPEANEELLAKKMAAHKAREYGIRVGELVKANRARPKATPRELSKQERAKEFAKTVPLPKQRSPKKADTAGQVGPSHSPAPPARHHKAAASTEPTLEGTASVETLMARHQNNTKTVDEIRAEVQRWEQEDEQLMQAAGQPASTRRAGQASSHDKPAKDAAAPSSDTAVKKERAAPSSDVVGKKEREDSTAAAPTVAARVSEEHEPPVGVSNEQEPPANAKNENEPEGVIADA
jgi:hypothetical protein